MEIASLYVTIGDLSGARTLARAVIAERLAACVTIVPEADSVYRWEGQVVESREAVLLLKTAPDRVEQLMARLIELHPYETPCVVVWRSDGGAAEYLQWVHAETRSEVVE